MKFLSALPLVATIVAVNAQQGAYQQCGGQDFHGGTTCVSGYTCQYSNPYYSQCVPGTGSAPATTATTLRTGSAPATTATTLRTSTTKSSPPATSSTPAGNGRVQYAGVNIAGFDFGCGIDGTCNTSATYFPPNAGGQMSHFVKDDGLNIFRLPVGWQTLVNNKLGGTLDATAFAKYDAAVQSCLSTGASCIIDVHNYARWNGGIIGQGGPSDDQFVSLWSQIAKKYAGNSKILFGVMNEPHDVPSITTWAATVQKVVTAIRQAGATSQKILLPGNNFTSAAQFISNGSLAALQTVKNPDGTTTNLIFDVHKYLDSDNSGTHTECVTNSISDAFAPLAAQLRSIGRQAILSETGGGNTASCAQYLCQEIAYLNQNSDVYLGYVTWAAGGFDSSYELTETPTQNGNGWTDTSLVSACVRR